MVRGYVPKHVWLALAELSYFFHQLCAKELSRKVVEDLENMALVLLYKLEKIFPPGFFNPMQHLILHLPYEAQMGGPVQDRWCYPIERCLKTLHKKCRNQAKIEASITEAFILEEVSNFTKKYYGENLPSVHNPPPRYNGGEDESNLSLFRGQLESASAWTTKTLTHAEWCCIMLYVLHNLEEWRRTWGKFSTSLFQYVVTIPHPTPCFTLVQGISSSLLESIEGSYPAGN
jgi:hypothetical protein